jgi:allantoinase
MSNSTIKNINNVFIATAGNKLRLADMFFDVKIREIRFKNHSPLEWKDISDKNKWNKFKGEFPVKLKQTEGNSSSGDFLLLMPGAVDPHVHFDTPGFEDREDFEHASLAAAYGGVTSIIDMPCTSKPPVTSLKNLQIKDAAIKGRSWIDYAFWGGVAGNDFSADLDVKKQIRELAEAGVVGFKAYLISGMDSFQDLTDTRMTRTAEWIHETGKPLAVHAEEKSLVTEREMRFRSAGQNNWWAYCKARDDRAEAGAISKLANIAGRTGCKIHIVHLSSEWGLNMVECAKDEGLEFSAETCPHYLYFTQDDFDDPKIANFLKTAPPVKSEYDRDALWKGLQNGLLSFVTTDHAGCDPEKEKKSENFWEVYGGIPGVEHRVPFLFSEGFLKGRLTLTQTIEHLSTSAAKYFGLYPQKGILQPESDADFALINLWEPMVVAASGMHSKGKYTPFEGIQFDARVEQTFLRGKIIDSRTGKPEVKIGHGQRIC